MRCSNCDHDNPLEAKFCMECGREVGAPDGNTYGRRSPLDVTPPHLAERIRRSGPDLVGEHKQVTVLFADVTGSMELQEGVDPETWHHHGPVLHDHVRGSQPLRGIGQQVHG